MADKVQHYYFAPGEMAAHRVLRKRSNAAVLKTSLHQPVYYCYILKYLKDSKYYFGYTSDLDERIKKHNSGGVTSTHHRIPLVIHYFETFATKSEAMAREKFFKSLEGRKWLYANKIL